MFFDAVPVTAHGIHRALCDLEPTISYVTAPDGSVRSWTDADVQAPAAGFTGVSCFSPESTGHGVPHSGLWAFDCGVLSGLLPGYRLVQDFTTQLRMRKDRKLTRSTVNHYSLFTTVPGKDLATFSAEVLSMFLPCLMRAAGPDSSVLSAPEEDDKDTLIPAEPWEASDLEGVLDVVVRNLYRVSQYAYPLTDNAALKIALNSLMTAIATHKPSREKLVQFELGLVREWYHALLACDSVVRPDALSLLGPAQAFFEDSLGVCDDDDDDDGEESTVEDPMSVRATSSMALAVDIDDSPDPVPESPRAGSRFDDDVTLGLASELVIDYLRFAFITTFVGHPVSKMGLLLQKVAFIVDVHCVAATGRRLVLERPQAWRNGPCYPAARLHFNATIGQAPTCPSIDVSVRSMLDAYLGRYCRMRPMDLVHLVHGTEFWASVPKGCNHQITSQEIAAAVSGLHNLLVFPVLVDSASTGCTVAAAPGTS